MVMKAQDIIEAKIMTALTRGEVAAAVNELLKSVDISGLTAADQLSLKVRMVRAFMFMQELRKGMVPKDTNNNGLINEIGG
jgi:hypothetical protein